MAENKYIDMIQGLVELAAELARSLLYIKSKFIHNRQPTPQTSDAEIQGQGTWVADLFTG